MIGGQARSCTAWIERARRAAGSGDSVMVLLKRLGQTLSPLPALAAIAAATQTIRIDTDELANDLRHPVVLARDAATREFLSDGRVELGSGGRVLRIGAPYRGGGVSVTRHLQVSSGLPTTMKGAWL